MELTFRSLQEAEAFGDEYVSDEPGFYYTVDRLPNGKYAINLFEEDGYLINRDAPTLTYGGKITVPGKMAVRHLG
jgi:hypothetical protein